MHSATADMEQEGGGSFSFDRAYSAVRHRLGFVAIVTAVTVACATFVAVVMSNRYEATAVVQIDPRKKTISNMDSVLSELKADSATVDSEVEILRSRAVALKVIDALNLRQDAEFRATEPIFNILKALIFGPSPADSEDQTEPSPATAAAEEAGNDPISSLLRGQKPGSDDPRRDEVAAAFLERLKVNRVRSTLLIEIHYSCSDAVKAAKIANTIAEVYIQEQLAAKQQAAGFATGLLEDKLGTLRGKVTDAERKVELFKAQNNIFDSEGQILSEKQLARHMEQTVLARNATAEARAKYEQIKKLNAEGLGDSAGGDLQVSDTVRLMKEQLTKAIQKEAELASKYGPLHPEMQKVKAEVDDARRQLSEEVAKLTQTLKSQFEIAEAHERQLGASLSVLKEQQAVSKEESVKLKQLEREAQTEKQIYEALLNRYKQTAETQELQLPDARIVEKADVPLFPAAPKRRQIVIISLFGGLIIGIGLALLLEFSTTGIARPEDVERAFELPHLSSIPQMILQDGNGADPLRPVRQVLAEPRGAYAEAIRGLRREIDVLRPKTGSNIVLVTSTLPGEETETVASNLAHHYALTGNQVLLIDADMRRAPLTALLAPGNSGGLLEVLSRAAQLERAILRDTTTGLCFLPAIGSSPSEVSSPELLASQRMAALVTFLRQQFDTIIIEAPPILPVVDARIVADYADQIAFVMTWRKTPKKLAKRAIALLGHNQEKLAGVIVNRVDPAVLDDVESYPFRAAPRGIPVPNQRHPASFENQMKSEHSINV